jgi:hypothetical protein
MPNIHRTQFDAMSHRLTSEARLETRKPNSIFIPPARRQVDTLVDWVADNPDFKQSRAYNRLMDAYYESLTTSLKGV